MDDETDMHGADQAVALTLARKATALWPAIEAAQYARLVDFETPRSEAQRATLRAFLDAFGHCAEEWEAVPDQNKAALFLSLDTHLSALARNGLHVHAGTTQQDFAMDDRQVALPIAVVHVGHNADAVLHVRMPERLEGLAP